MYKPNEREYRAFLGGFSIEERAGDSEKKELIIRGEPVVFNKPTCLAEFEGEKFYEQIDPHAFDEADMSDFIFNVNHNDAPYARNKNGTLTYEIGDKFTIEAKLNPDDLRHQQLYMDISTGLIDKMSFAFTVQEEKYDKEEHLRTITKIKKLYDVSAVTFPAYEQTSIGARSFFEEEFKKERELMEYEARKKRLLERLKGDNDNA